MSAESFASPTRHSHQASLPWTLPGNRASSATSCAHGAPISTRSASCETFVGSSLNGYVGRRDVDLLLGELDAIARRHGLEGDVYSESDLRYAYVGSDQLAEALQSRMQGLRVGDELVLPNGTLVTQDDRGYVVDATRRAGVDAGVAAAIAVGRDEQRAHDARSDAAGSVAYAAERLGTAAVMLRNEEIPEARAAAEQAVAVLADAGHPAAPRMVDLAESIRPEITDLQRVGVPDALRVEALRLNHDARFLQEVITDPQIAARDCRLEDAEHPFHGPHLPGEEPLPAVIVDRNDAWRREVIVAERAERQATAREQRFALQPSAAALEHLAGVDAQPVTVQLTIARDLLSRDEVDSAQTAVAVAVMGLEQAAQRPELAAELDAWVAEFPPYAEGDYEHPAYETTRHAEVLLTELDAIAERHGIQIDPDSSSGALGPAELSEERLLERRLGGCRSARRSRSPTARASSDASSRTPSTTSRSAPIRCSPPAPRWTAAPIGLRAALTRPTHRARRPLT